MTEASSSLDRSETRGLALGFVGVVIFAMTLPMTRLAVGAAGDCAGAGKEPLQLCRKVPAQGE